MDPDSLAFSALTPSRVRSTRKRGVREMARIVDEERALDAYTSGSVSRGRKQPDEDEQHTTPQHRHVDGTNMEPSLLEGLSGSYHVVNNTLQTECCESPRFIEDEGDILCCNCERMIVEASTLVPRGYDSGTEETFYGQDLLVTDPTWVTNQGLGAWPHLNSFGYDSPIVNAGDPSDSNQTSYDDDNNDVFEMTYNEQALAIDEDQVPKLHDTEWPPRYMGFGRARSENRSIGDVSSEQVPEATQTPGSQGDATRQAAAMSLVKSCMHQSDMSENVTSNESSQSLDAVCKLCGGNHDSSNCAIPPPTFHRFMDLAPELRERIYGFALACPEPVNPHLCDASFGAIKFHDASQAEHNAVNKLLGITRASKQIRSESLPFFYSTNTFLVGNDTTTYFERLSHLGRFHLVRHVRFIIPLRSEGSAAGLLRQINQYIKEADKYEKNARNHDVGANYTTLIHHPQYLNGGISELNNIIALRKLTTPLSTTNATYSSQLVLPVPTAERFTSHERLKWFPIVLYGLGIKIHFVEDHLLNDSAPGCISITWHQKFQKKNFSHEEQKNVVRYDDSGQTEAYRRALEICPQLESLPRPRGRCYMRMNCKGVVVGWCDLATEGGGVFPG